MPFPAGDESRIVARRPGPRTRGDAGRLAVMPRLFVATRLPPEVVDLLEAELDGAPAAACRLGPATRRLGDRAAGPGHPPQPVQADVVLARGRVPQELAGRPVTGSWTARSVSLVADRSSPREVRLEDLATFPLEDPGSA
jgi:hypothetical protein